MTTLLEKISKLPPSLLPKLERIVDLLPEVNDRWLKDLEWQAPRFDESGEKAHPQPGCMKGTFVMHDNFFEPDDDWEEYM